MNFTSIWKQTKKEIKSKIPDHAYSTWVEPIKLIGFNDNVLRLKFLISSSIVGYNLIITISLCRHSQICLT